jgi:hypothetical protein
MDVYRTGGVPPQPAIIIEASLLPRETKDKMLEALAATTNMEQNDKQATNMREILKPIMKQLFEELSGRGGEQESQ